ncbi:MAG: peptidase M14 [Planctomycetia bacterium]|nr:peptidase M14 [Planctomycetia bacterium]
MPPRLRFGLVSLMLVALLAPLAGAEPPAPYPVMGAPANPKVPAQWNRYHDCAEIGDLLKKLVKDHPRYAKLHSQGKSYGGREMWIITITDSQQGKEAEKPAFWIDGGIHANEIQASEVAAYTAWFVLESAGRTPWIDRLLKERVLYIAPLMSPDSRDDHFYKANNTHTPRSGQRPLDEAATIRGRYGRRQRDLDGDGNITQMRIRDPNGKFKSDPDYPQLMVHVKEGEKGEYSLLGPEGIDGQGEPNHDEPGYYDPNRDWAWDWQPSYVQPGAYHYPFSVLENRMMADFIMSKPNIAGAQSYHNAGGMILRGPGVPGMEIEAADVKVFDELAHQGEKMLPGYRYLKVGDQLYASYGAELDWLFQMRGAYAFTNELFAPSNFFRESNDEGFFGKASTRAKFDKAYLFNEGTVAWHEVLHPQFGKVEVGGEKKSWGRQPPSFLLEEECHRNMAFSLYHADQMPLVAVQSVDVKPLGKNLFQVTAIVENQRLCPTHTAGDVRHKITAPDIVRIEGKDLHVVLGLTDNEQFFRDPTEQKHRPAALRLATIPGRSVVYCRWIVEGAGPYTVSVTSVKGGRDSRVAEVAK